MRFTGVTIPEGAIFYGKTRRRQDVVFDKELRLETEDTAKRFHELVEAGRTPKPVYGKMCNNCSMYELCLPKTIERGKVINSYLSEAVKET